MQHPHLGEYEIEIAGAARKFRLSMLEAYTIDKAMRPDKISLANLSADQISVPFVVDVFHMCCMAYDPKLKKETVLEWLSQDPGSFTRLADAVGRAIVRLFKGDSPDRGDGDSGPLGQEGAAQDTPSLSDAAAAN
jgi:hypothetical protein